MQFKAEVHERRTNLSRTPVRRNGDAHCNTNNSNLSEYGLNHNSSKKYFNNTIENECEYKQNHI